jgi:hypothetical protein
LLDCIRVGGIVPKWLFLNGSGLRRLKEKRRKRQNPKKLLSDKFF